jgi:hypothetical protein
VAATNGGGVNARVWLLLQDYARRTRGAWLIIAFIQIIQTVAFGAVGIRHAPLLGTVFASFTYAVMSQKPRAALRILPLSPVDVALFRWWSSFGIPALFILVCTVAAGMLSDSKGWMVPAESLVDASATAVVVVLAGMSAIEARPRLMPVWGAAAVAGLVGLPVSATSRPLLLLLGVAGVGFSIVSSLQTPARQLLLRKPAPPAPFGGRFRGWSVLFIEVARTTALTSVVALVATAILHVAIAPLTLSRFHGAVIWLVVSAVAAATCLPMQRWIEAVCSLRILPLDGRWLALIVYLTTMMPGMVTCLVLIGAQQISPRVGLDIPCYLWIVFLLAPITLVRWQRPREASPVLQEWVPAIQQSAWTIWAGSFCALGSVSSLPGFLLYLSIVAALFFLAGYRAILAVIRSPAELVENHDSALQC